MPHRDKSQKCYIGMNLEWLNCTQTMITSTYLILLLIRPLLVHRQRNLVDAWMLYCIDSYQIIGIKISHDKIRPFLNIGSIYYYLTLRRFNCIILTNEDMHHASFCY